MRDRSQLVLPMELGVKIAESDPVRKLVEICEELDYTELYKQYVKAWRKYNPETLFELVVFGYMQRWFSTRQIEEVHIPPPQSTLNRSRCAPQPREMSTATADIVHRKSTHKQTPAETFPPQERREAQA